MTDKTGRWYDNGLAFECTRCGNCCTGPPGAVWFTKAEGRAMAAHLGLPETDFLKQYAQTIDGKWSLKERKGPAGWDCVFLTRDGEGLAGCSLYRARPVQCRTWPFWPELLSSPGAWESARRETPCPGMGSGKMIPVEDIVRRLTEKRN